jgi:hypothetical protein
MKRCRIPAVAFCSLLLVSALLLLGCEIGNSDSTTRNISVNFTGFYDSTATNSDFVSPANSGSRVTSFNLMQSGDQLTAIDNNNLVFHGSVGDASGDAGSGTANFQLEGQTTAGQSVTIAGTLSGANTGGNSALGTMNGTWIEPNLYAHILGDAIINAIVTNSPVQPTGTTAVAISPTTVTLNSSGASANFTASGGGGGFSWSIGNGNLGTLTANGNLATYTRLIAGTNTVTVSDSANTANKATATVNQP